MGKTDRHYGRDRCMDPLGWGSSQEIGHHSSSERSQLQTPSYGSNSLFLSSEATPSPRPRCQWLALPWPCPRHEANCPGGRTLTRWPRGFRATTFCLKWDLDHRPLLLHPLPGPGQVSMCLCPLLLQRPVTSAISYFHRQNSYSSTQRSQGRRLWSAMRTHLPPACSGRT